MTEPGPPAAASTDLRLARLLAYVQAAKKAAAVAGHQGHSAEDDSYHMGRSVAYQDIENLLTRITRKQHDDQETGS
jgi:hypothetical protein